MAYRTATAQTGPPRAREAVRSQRRAVSTVEQQRREQWGKLMGARVKAAWQTLQREQ